MSFPANGIPGIDVSHYQGVIDWAALIAGSGERFVYVVGSSRVDLQACKLEYSIVSPK